MTTPASDPVPHVAPESDPAAPEGVNLPLPPLSLVNPLVIIVALSVVAAGIAAAFGNVLFAAWFLVGGLLALGNAKLVMLKVSTATAEAQPRKAPVAINATFRLAVVTVIALAVAWLFKPAGLGLIFGLAIGQVVLVLHSVIPVLKGLRTQS
ncbi:hypothetical protein P0W64_12505 [Tsukamurella sp. 8F]|uniref:hypothetical protein n=1 Tax=unclassified Tsukamurella TaxID=2633480 RepID=UPI0023B9379F|nr:MULTISPECIES: hypothetical protein [unclassified Tsukamurella]MDF0530300.1 hypothetical protein [Tsukamurella sp. 8J]MDF0587597.1 hypothetical protein [Tsukamurella sp. 8F]